MTIDPVTAAAATAATAAITKTTSWLWDKYGKDLLDKASKAVLEKSGREGKKLWDERQWKKSAETYLNNLYDDVSTLRVLGKMENQPIERMYTDVNVLGELSAERRVKLAQLPDEYEERVGLRWQQKARQDGLELARKTKRLFILGKPGAGKTTFLKHVALQTIKGETGEKIPIFISLWRLANSGQALMPYIVEQFRICGFPEAEPFLREMLMKGDALVLFDGLDEVRVEDEQRDQLITAVEDFGREFRDSQVFITCRLAVTDYTFDGFKYVEMADFDLKQMQTFVFRWFQHDVTQRNACWEALKADHNKTLRELAQVPLLLSLLCLTYEKRNEFPQERDEIYKEATDALLNDWDASRRVKRGQEIVRENAVYENLTLKNKQKLLAHVAAQTFDDGQYFLEEARLAYLIETFLPGVPGLKDKEVNGAEVLRVMEAQHGIFVERAHKIHSFSHLTLQEYYAARYIVENEAGGTLPRLMAHVGEDRWRELFLLTASMLSDATDFCHLYLQALQKMMSNDEKLTTLLMWAAVKSAQVNASVGGYLSGWRAFYIFLARESTLGRALARDDILDLNIDLLRDHTLDLDRALEFDLDFDINLTRAHARALDLVRARAHTLALDNALVVDIDCTLARGLTYARDLDRALDRAIAHVHDLDLPLDLSLDLDLDPNLSFRPNALLSLDYLLSMLLQFTKVLALAGTMAMNVEIAGELRETTAQLNQLCLNVHLLDLQAALVALPLPTVDTTDTELHTFATRLAEIARTHRNLGYEWNLSRKQVDLLEKNLKANLLLIECLNLAYVPDRTAIENQILLPPPLVRS